MDTFLFILMLAALAGMIFFAVLAFVKGKENRLRNFAKSGGSLFALLSLSMIFASTGDDSAWATILLILMLAALAGMIFFAVLAFVKGKENRLRNFAKSGGFLFAFLALSMILGSSGDDSAWETILLVFMLAALAGMIFFAVLAFVKGKENRLRNFSKSGGFLFALLALSMIFGSTGDDSAWETILLILMLAALAGMVVFVILAFVKGKGTRGRNFAKSGGFLFAFVVLAVILGAIAEEAPIADEVAVEASAEDKEDEEQAQKEKEEQEAKEAEEQAQKEKEEQEAKEAEEQAQKEKEEQEAKEAEEQAQKEKEEQEAKEAEEQAQKEKEEQEAKEAEEQAQKEKEEQEAKEAEEQAQKEKEEQEAKEAEENSVTGSQEQAVRTAQSYLDYTAFSKTGLIEQLEYEGFSQGDAAYAVDIITVDWREQAVIAAQDYIDYTAFSREGLIDQLQYEGYSTEDAAYAVENITVDWREQAVIAAQDYLDYTSFSRQGLIDQLVFEGYSTEDATYAAGQVGL